MHINKFNYVSGEVLGRVSKTSQDEHDILLSACLVSKAIGRPNGAFFDLARELEQLSQDDDEEPFWIEQMGKLRRWKAAAGR